jgi:ABC-2 type transport system permease protein
VVYLTGSLVFGFMSECTNGSLNSVLGASGLIKKVYIPKYIFPLEKCLFALVNTMLSLIAVLIMMPILGVAPAPTILLFPLPLLYTLAFSAGLGMALSAVNVYFRDIGHLWSVLTTAWMYFTPILYPADAVPQAVKGIIAANPMYYYVDYFRRVVMYGQLPDLRLNLICAAFSLSFLIAGVLVFKALQDRFILYI